MALSSDMQKRLSANGTLGTKWTKHSGLVKRSVTVSSTIGNYALLDQPLNVKVILYVGVKIKQFKYKSQLDVCF